MREQEFKAWLETCPARTESGKLDPKTISTYMTDLRRVIKDAGNNDQPLDIAAEFQKDGLLSLIELYNYTKADEDAGLDNPTNTIGNTASLSKFLQQYKRAIILYRRFLLSDGDESVIEEEVSDTGAIFGIEAELQEVIRETISQLEEGLVAIDHGVEYRVTSGRIDILAQDAEGRFVVIELKAGKAEGGVIGQILGYMVNIAEEKQVPIEQVRGIIIAADFNSRVLSAVRLTTQIELKSYRYSFDFKNKTPDRIN